MSRMDDLQRNSPEQPDYTCQFIDPVIEEIDNMVKELRDLAKRIEYHTDKNCDLEQLRQMNADLRYHGNYWHEQCAILCNKLDEAEDELTVVREELAQLRGAQSSPVMPDQPTMENGHEQEVNLFF